MLLNCGVGENSCESLGQQGDQTSQFWKKLTLNIHWKDWCWMSNTLTTWCKEPTHWKRLWCWERLGAGGEGDNWGWDGWMASLTRWTWVWVNSGSRWWTGRPDVLWFMGSQRVAYNWAIELTQASCRVKNRLWTHWECSLMGWDSLSSNQPDCNKITKVKTGILGERVEV